MVDRTFDNTTDGLRAWLEERGPSYFGGNARLYATAVDRIASQRVANEPATVEWMLSHLDALGKRLAHREKLASNSLTTYVSRARTAGQHYADWTANPVGWSPTSRTARKSSSTSSKGDERKMRPDKGGDRSVAASTPPALIAGLPVSSASDMQQQVSEALVAIARWPLLQPFLLRGLMEAIESERRNGTE